MFQVPLVTGTMLTIAAAVLLTVAAPSPAVQPARPPGSAGHALVYHEGLQAVVLVNAGLGGMTNPPANTPTRLWRWNGTEWSVLDAAGPPIRNLAGVCYDTGRDVIVMFGGSYSADVTYDETWEWSRTSGGWAKRAVAGPGKRDHTRMVFDKVRMKSVLFGGQATLTSFPTSTWTWDGSKWEEFPSQTPGARIHHALVYDPIGERTLMFGGSSPDQKADLGDTWAWTGSGWKQAAAPTSTRTHAELGLTSTGVILAGGMETGTILELGGGAWKPAPAAGGPGVRYLTAMAYDPRRRVTVLFGGGDPAADRLFDDTWELGATGWRKVR